MLQSVPVLVAVAVGSVSIPGAVPRSIGIGEKLLQPRAMEEPGADPGLGLPPGSCSPIRPPEPGRRASTPCLSSPEFSPPAG